MRGRDMNARMLGLAALLPATALAQAIDNPWSLVPALPTACYQGLDHTAETIDASRATLSEAIDAQKAINDDAANEVGDMVEVDPFAMAAKMQEYAMNNPEKMTEMMESLYSTGQTMGDDMNEDIAREQELVGAIDALIARYKSEYDEMRKPFQAAIDALPTEPSEAGDVFTREAIAQLPAINKQGQADYEAFCARWWQPGSFPARLAEYRAFLTEERVPREDNVFEQTTNQWMIHGVDVSVTHSVASMEAVQDYLGQMQRIYKLRVDEPARLHIRTDW
jgi:hypothetical protein